MTKILELINTDSVVLREAILDMVGTLIASFPTNKKIPELYLISINFIDIILGVAFSPYSYFVEEFSRDFGHEALIHDFQRLQQNPIIR